MIGGLLLIVFLFVINQAMYNNFGKKHKFFSKRLMNNLFFYHIFFFLVYYTYASFNRSDSKLYYRRPGSGEPWLDYFGTSTTFIDFLSWPFINILNFSYEMMMVFYAWLGYIGFIYAYLFFRENIPIRIKVFKKIDFLTLILFLPNMHFWTASLGKGAPIFMGLMMYAYALTKTRKRWFILIFSSLIIYFIRPHVFLFVAVGTVLGYMTGKEKISFGKKLLIYVVMVGGLVLVKDQILEMAGLNGSEDLVEDFQSFSNVRSRELSRPAGSGVAISSYPLPLKLFTFWFRPLFFDAPGILGLIVSVENLLYLLLFIKLFKKGVWKFLKNSPVSVKMSLTLFLLSSFALTFVMSNLGLIMRQKSMVMYFLFFVIYYFLAQKKYDKIMWKRRKLREQKLKEETTLANV